MTCVSLDLNRQHTPLFLIFDFLVVMEFYDFSCLTYVFTKYRFCQYQTFAVFYGRRLWVCLATAACIGRVSCRLLEVRRCEPSDRRFFYFGGSWLARGAWPRRTSRSAVRQRVLQGSPSLQLAEACVRAGARSPLRQSKSMRCVRASECRMLSVCRASVALQCSVGLVGPDLESPDGLFESALPQRSASIRESKRSSSLAEDHVGSAVRESVQKSSRAMVCLFSLVHVSKRI